MLIRSLCRAEDVRLVLPSTDHELEALATLRPALAAAGAHVAVCDAALLEVLRDKGALYAELAAAGLPVLPAIEPGALRARLPVIGKPRRGWGSRGVVVVRDAAELEALPARAPGTLVWQPFLAGAHELSADFAIPDVSRRSPRWACAAGVRRRRASLSSPRASRTRPRAPSSSASRDGRARAGRGLFNVQLLQQERTLVISDVNPRLGTSAVHWRASGFNPVLALCADAGLAPDGSGRAPARGGTRSVRHLEERVLPATPGKAVSGIVFDLDDTLVPMKRWLRDRLLLALERLVEPGERAAVRLAALRIIEEGPRDG